MIIPSIDLQDGQAVQLVGGRERALEAGDPRPLMERFRLAGEVAVIDLDAALGQGENTAAIEPLLALGPCRVGGGIRDAARARQWLDRGAAKVILGTAATPEVLRELPPERVIAALDAVQGEVVVHGWRTRTGESILDRMRALEGLVGGFLVTFVEREGRLGGTDLERVAALREAAGDAALTVAGGVTGLAEIAELHHRGVDAQVGMALYTGKLELGDCISAPLSSDRPDGLWPTVVCDEAGRALGLAYSDAESVREAVRLRQGAYHSRKRGLWIKGRTSGDTQQLLRIDLDCDADALRFTVRQEGAGFCHRGTDTCWGALSGLAALERTVQARRDTAPPGSYTRRLFDDPALLSAKLREEAAELAEAAEQAEAAELAESAEQAESAAQAESAEQAESAAQAVAAEPTGGPAAGGEPNGGATAGGAPADPRAAAVAWEAADVLYFTAVALARAGVRLADVERVLDARARKVTRRPGDAKPPAGVAAPGSPPGQGNGAGS